MAAFVEHFNGGNYRKHMFRDMSSSGVFDLPVELHVLKSESLEQPDENRAEIFDNTATGSLLMENGDEIRLENTNKVIVKEN